MDKLKSFGPWLIIIVLVVVLVLQRGCRFDRLSDRGNDTIRYSDTIRDTVPVVVKVDVPVPYEVENPPDTFFYLPDSAECLRMLREIDGKYYCKYVYLDTLKDDSSAFITLRDTVFKNRLMTRELYYINRRATVINTTYVYPDDRRFKMFVGMSVGGRFDRLSDPTIQRWSLAPALLFQTKSDITTGIRYDLLNKIVGVDFFWKLSFRKKRPP